MASLEPAGEAAPKRITATTARGHGLTKYDLGRLFCTYVPNPRQKRAADPQKIRLYLETEVQQLAAAKKARLNYEAEYPEEAAEAKAAAKAATKAAALEAARTMVSGFERRAPTNSMPAGSTLLPQEVWRVIFTHLVPDTLDPLGGLRGPDTVARDIMRAGLACRDMWHASREGLDKLAAVAPILSSDECWLGPHRPLLPPSSDWPAWDALLRQPTKHKLADLKQAARDLNLRVSGTKPELVLRLLGHFELRAPCPMPVRLWVALKQK
ncbi:hypothetical protein TSOC_010897 [Tetrabaena socialis]|uniref:SAP domain-containing protein n=1 Tax=Tetrabaena socialis TaxID=47790 RepID=A0A2J7ZS32_9CHLO|nr:hypothetical protein TSOC_010897 [Tetrabaena socialis]|eukprot:PNH03075.1 hypothetical protein TSOC_010897 [Tetrabaena socialis]